MTTPSTIAAVPIERATLADLRRAARKLDTATNERNQLVLRAQDEGASLRDIAEALGMNHVTVSNLIRKLRS